MCPIPTGSLQTRHNQQATLKYYGEGACFGMETGFNNGLKTTDKKQLNSETVKQLTLVR
jgi:hypothetical protein